MAMANGSPTYPKTRAALAAYFDLPTTVNAERVHVAFAEEGPAATPSLRSLAGRLTTVEAIWEWIRHAK